MRIISKIKTLWLYAVLIPIKLGDGIFHKLNFAMASAFLLFFKKHTWRIRLNFRGKSFPFELRSWIDLGIIKDVLVDEEYNIAELTAPSVIMDVGANVGLSVCYFKTIFPTARVIAIEPDPSNFERLKENTANFSDVVCLNYAVSNNDGQTLLHVGTNAHSSSSLVDRFASSGAIRVQTRTLDTIMKEVGVYSIDLLKFDVEGAEYDAFEKFIGLSQTRFLIGEVHLDLMKKTRKEFLLIFKKFDIETRDMRANRFMAKISQ